MLHDIHKMKLIQNYVSLLVSSGVRTHIYLGTEYFSFYALYFPHHTHVFFSCVTFVAILDTEHCVLFDLHVRDRIEYIKKKKKTVKKETNNEGGWLDNVVNRFNGIDTPFTLSIFHQPATQRLLSNFKFTMMMKFDEFN